MNSTQIKGIHYSMFPNKSLECPNNDYIEQLSMNEPSLPWHRRKHFWLLFWKSREKYGVISKWWQICSVPSCIIFLPLCYTKLLNMSSIWKLVTRRWASRSIIVLSVIYTCLLAEDLFHKSGHRLAIVIKWSFVHMLVDVLLMALLLLIIERQAITICY